MDLVQKKVLFENVEIRTELVKKECFYSIIDIVKILAQKETYEEARKYWKTTKRNLSCEGSELVTICYQLKMQCADGKNRMTDVANREGILRIIQSIPSPKAEPFKRWLARVGDERFREEANPNLSIDRAKRTWLANGKDEDYINTRLETKKFRKDFVQELLDRDVTHPFQIGQMTNICQKWTGFENTTQHKEFKHLPKSANLRDHMSETELCLTKTSEDVARIICKFNNLKGLNQVKTACVDGSNAALEARKIIEKATGKKVDLSLNNFCKNNLKIDTFLTNKIKN